MAGEGGGGPAGVPGVGGAVAFRLAPAAMARYTPRANSRTPRPQQTPLTAGGTSMKRKTNPIPMENSPANRSPPPMAARVFASWAIAATDGHSRLGVRVLCSRAHL